MVSWHISKPRNVVKNSHLQNPRSEVQGKSADWGKYLYCTTACTAHTDLRELRSFKELIHTKKVALKHHQWVNKGDNSNSNCDLFPLFPRHYIKQ